MLLIAAQGRMGLDIPVWWNRGTLVFPCAVSQPRDLRENSDPGELPAGFFQSQKSSWKEMTRGEK